MTEKDQEFARKLIKRNRYLTLSTTDGVKPWAAPLEYLSDDRNNLYFFSPVDSVHVRNLENCKEVAVAIFDIPQPEYEPASVIRISGIQIMATAQTLDPPYPSFIEQQIEAWQLPMPPYAVFKIVPEHWYIPVIKDGVNVRYEVPLGA